MNLLVEYCKRHKVEMVMPSDNGVCFFNFDNEPNLICLTSVGPKVYNSCLECTSTSLVVELFTKNHTGGYAFIGHHHIEPEADLISFVIKCGWHKSLLKPVYIKNNGDIEKWLWRFFLFSQSLAKSPRWLSWCETLNSEGDFRIIEEITHCAIAHNNVFGVFYEMCQDLVAGRKYLLFE